MTILPLSIYLFSLILSISFLNFSYFSYIFPSCGELPLSGCPAVVTGRALVALPPAAGHALTLLALIHFLRPQPAGSAISAASRPLSSPLPPAAGCLRQRCCLSASARA